MPRAFVIASVIATLTCLEARAAEYLIASLIGDRITVANAVISTGSNMDRNAYLVVNVPQLPFDDAIHNAIAGAVSKVDPQATFKGLAFREGLPGVESLDREEPSAIAKRLVTMLAPQIKSGEKQWIVALIPLRVEPRMRLRDGYIGHGRVAGVGYYVDRMSRIRRSDTGETDDGFLGAFANFTIAMVDPATGAIVAKVPVQQGVLRAVAGSGKIHPWDVISAEDKLRLINGLVSRELRQAMPEVLTGAGVK